MRFIPKTFFTDEEYDSLKKIKGDKSWHDFIMTLTKSKSKPKGIFDVDDDYINDLLK